MKWKLDRLTNKGTVCNGKVRFAITCNDDGFKRDVIATTPYADKFPEEYHEANAKLISAAPEMLEVAKELYTAIGEALIDGELGAPWREIQNKLGTTIKKAEVIK